MVKRALTLLTSILIALPLLMPFNIYADESVNTAPFLGVNVQFTEVETEYTSMTMPILNFGYAGTQNTSGSVTGKMACSALSGGECKTWSLQNSNGNSVAGLSFTLNLANLKLTENGVWQFNKAYNYIVDYEFVLDGDYKGYVVLNGDTTIYVNGRSFHHSVRQNGISEITFTITDYELIKVTQPFLWDIPIESFSAIIYPLQHYDTYQYNQVNNYIYPSFFINNGDIVFQRLNYTYETYKWIFITSENMHSIITDSPSSLYRYFKMYDLNGNELDFEFTSYTAIDRSLVISDGIVGKFVSVEFKVKGGHLNFYNCKFIYPSNMIYIPIYLNVNTNKNISTDFALQFGLSNRLLDDLNLIANGTVQSNSAASSNDLANEQLKTDSNTLFEQENGFKSNMQSAMQNVNNTFRLQDMGTKFVSSAQWVRTQYEQLTNNTPFASLITFSLITGLALILLGKVYK